MRLTLKTCLTLTLIVSTTLVGCSLWGCQAPLSERPGRTSVTVTIESPPLRAQQNLSEGLIRSLLSSTEGQALLQRALMKLYFEARGVTDFKEIPTWRELTQASAKLLPEPSEAELRRLYQRRYPEGQRLTGVQLTLSASHSWRLADWRRFEASLMYWSRTSLSRARQALLQGEGAEALSQKLSLTVLKGEPLFKHLGQLKSPHLRGLIKRLRAGEISQVIEHHEGACLYVVEATPKQLKESLPHAVSASSTRLRAQLNQKERSRAELTRLSHEGALSALCLDVSLKGLKGPTGRGFDQWLRARLLSLKQLGALNQSTLDAFSLSVESLKPEDWPPQLTRQLSAVTLTPAERAAGWYQAEAEDQLWLVKLTKRAPITFAEARPALEELYKQQRGEEINQRLLIEQGWEELSPKLLLQAPGAQLEELELSAPALD